MKQFWEIDVNVLLIFFVRDKVFQKTFDAVKKARPRRLFLWQDGPRAGRPDDLEGIERCRKIAENIDWDCEVYTKYNEKNIGCDPSIYYAYKWAFSYVDKCIFLEDENVLFSGDFIFNNSIGRMDLPTSNRMSMFNSLTKITPILKRKNYLIYSGHDEEETTSELLFKENAYLKRFY